MNHSKNEIDNPAYFQHTLKDSFTCVGRGLHTGLKIVMRVTPGEPDSGIVFVRRDVDTRRSEIQALWNNVSDTRLSTTITNSRGVRVSTIEHLMAALYASGIDNARILLDGPEVPIMDGSAGPFTALIRQTGKTQQDAECRAIVIKQSIAVTDGDKFAGFLPSPVPWMELEIDFDSKPIGKQKLTAPLLEEVFARDLADARTFGFREQVNTLHKLGLAQGGSLVNAILIENDEIINQEGLRYENEFVRHKMVDCIGDIALVGAHLMGQFSGVQTGHKMNSALIHKLMLHEYAWEYTTVREANNYWRQIMELPYADNDLPDEIMSRLDLQVN